MKRGVFVRPERVDVEEWPPLEDLEDLEDMDEIYGARRELR